MGRYNPAEPRRIYGITAHQSAVGSNSGAAHTAGSITIPANTIVAGDRFDLRMVASFTSAGTPNISCLFRISDGTNTHTLIDLSETSAAGAGAFHANIAMSCLTDGASGKIDSAGFGLAANASTQGTQTNVSLKTNVDVTVSVVIQFNQTNASNTVTVRELSALRITDK